MNANAIALTKACDFVSNRRRRGGGGGGGKREGFASATLLTFFYQEKKSRRHTRKMTARKMTARKMTLCLPFATSHVFILVFKWHYSIPVR